MPKDPLQPDRCAAFLSALAAAERLVIVRLLRENGPMSTIDISAAAGAPPTTVSHHLDVLRRARLVKRERRGRHVSYRLFPRFLDAENPDGFLDLGCCRIQYPAPPRPRAGLKRSKPSG